LTELPDRFAGDRPDDRRIELNVVGESHRQDALAAIAGPKEYDGKDMRVGVTLRCEPSNPHDRNAIRVEVMGQHVAFIAKEQAAKLSPPIRQHCGGAMEAGGLIVGGWQRGGGDEGYYGIRVWINARDAARIDVRLEDLDPQIVHRRGRVWPELPPVAPGERRLSPTTDDFDAGLYGSALTVTCEEHYQAEIQSAMPAGVDADGPWPLLVEFAIAVANPHAAERLPCIQVRIAGGRTIGYLTPRMSERYGPQIRRCIDSGQRPTASATVARGTKGGATVWRVKASMLNL
jgi:hypothetical protein